MWFRFDIVWGAIDFPHLQESWLKCRIESQTWNEHWLSKRVIFYLSANSAQGYCHHLCLSVRPSIHPHFGRPMYLYNYAPHINYSYTNDLLMRRGVHSMQNCGISIDFLEKNVIFHSLKKKFGEWFELGHWPLEICPILNIYLISNIDCWYHL